MAMGDWRLFFHHRDQVKKVTVQDVQRVASTYLKPSNRTLGLFIPTEKPDRVEIAAAPSVDSVLKGYRSEAVVAAGEAFDPTPANVEARVHRGTLASGLRVALLAKKNRGEAVTALVNLRMGNEQTLTNRAIASALTGSMLMRGTKNLTRQQLRDSLDKLKARVTVSSPAVGSVRVAIETMRPNLPATLRLVGDMLRQPSLDATEFEQLQRETLAPIEAQRGEPTVLGQIAFNRSITRYTKGHPRYVATIDEQIEFVKATTIADVRKFHADFYGASNGELVVVGDNFEPEITKLAAELFGAWKSPNGYKPVPVVLAATTSGRQTVETPDKANALFVAGQTFPMKDVDPDYPAMLLANYLLGEQPLDSRIPARVRVKESLSYIAQSILNVPTLDRTGQWIAVAISSPQNSAKVDAAFFDEMSKVLKDGFSAEEVEKGKSAWLQRRRLGRANDATLAGQLSGALFIGRTLAADEELEKKVAALTADQVNAAVRRTLDTSKMTVILAGDFAKVQQAGKPQ